MAPAPGGALYVLASQPDGSVLTLLDRSGRPSPGWPITIGEAPTCNVLLTADDGSVRVVCPTSDLNSGEVRPAQAFAFNPNGRPKPGWPIELTCCSNGQFVGRVIGDTLTVYDRQYADGTVTSRVVAIMADGTVRNGTSLSAANCCTEVAAVGPDGIAYLLRYNIPENPSESTSELSAIGPAGAVPGFPIDFEGVSSLPGFDASGRLHVTVATLNSDTSYHGPGQTFVFEPDGRPVDAGSGNLGLVATDECSGIEGSCVFPAAPLVSADGTTFVIEAGYNSTTVAGLNPAGGTMGGWPYQSDGGHQGNSICLDGDICEGYSLATPTLGPDGVLYLIHRAVDESAGGSTIVAVGLDGRVLPGWPVELKRPGAAFWEVAVGADGTAFALAIEPEGSATTSATILAIAPDGTVLYTTTIVEP